jgi:hypothetical protein
MIGNAVDANLAIPSFGAWILNAMRSLVHEHVSTGGGWR